MPFRVTNISNEILNTKSEYNKTIVIDDITIHPGQSIFYNWDIVPTSVNILRLQNLVIVESVSINDYNFIQQDNTIKNNVIEDIVNVVTEEDIEVAGEIINEEPIVENVVEEIKIETKPKVTRKKKTEK